MQGNFYYFEKVMDRETDRFHCTSMSTRDCLQCFNINSTKDLNYCDDRGSSVAIIRGLYNLVDPKRSGG